MKVIMTSKKKKLVTNIIFYALIVLIYGFVIFQVIAKFNGGVMYVFGTRYDVVLTDSMSSKHPNHLDFLEGTCQFQPFDMIRSRKIDENTDIKLKDVVLFKNPDLQGATVAHRVAEIVQKNDTLNTFKITKKQFNHIDTMVMGDYSSYINLSQQSLAKVEIEFLSSSEPTNSFSFNFGGAYLESTLSSTKIDNYYENTLIAIIETHAEKPMRIAPSALEDLYLTKINYTMHTGKTFSFTVEDYVEEVEAYETPINIVNYYKLRADKSNSFDANGSLFAKSDLIARVENVLPKIGHVVRFLSSVPGIVLLVGLAIIITIASYLYNKMYAEKLSETVTTEVTETETPKVEEKKEDKEAEHEGES